jgi:hypothetical protein
MIRFLSGLSLLLITFILQFFLASIGIYINLTFAVLIAFAFILTFPELVILDLFAVLITNWQPGPSVEIIAFAAIPLAAYGAKKWLGLEPWSGVVGGIVIGYAAFYFAVTESGFFLRGFMFWEDVIIGLVAAELIVLLVQ